MTLDVYTHQLSFADSTNMYISLEGTPVSSENVALDIIGGTAQGLGRDFRVDGTKVAWDNSAMDLYSQLASGDEIRIIYDRS